MARKSKKDTTNNETHNRLSPSKDPWSDLPTVSSKMALRQKVEHQIQQYLSAGKRICNV